MGSWLSLAFILSPQNLQVYHTIVLCPEHMACLLFKSMNVVSISPVEWKTKTLQDDPVVESNTRGTISFATSGPNSRTTQMFINFGDNSNLDSMGFSPFGKVIEGMDTVDRIFKIGERPQQVRPSLPHVAF